MDAILFWLLKSISNQVETVELIGMGAFGGSFLLLLHFVLFKQLKESYQLFKKFKSNQDFFVYLDEANLFFPFQLLEGYWREKSRNEVGNFLKIPFEGIEEYLVEPARGIKRMTPRYYKIKLRGQGEYVYILRSYFKKREVEFIKKLQSKMSNIILNDELR
jgi:hypothetical protein